MQARASSLLTAVLAAHAIGCRYEQDSVLAGYYGPVQAGTSSYELGAQRGGAPSSEAGSAGTQAPDNAEATAGSGVTAGPGAGVASTRCDLTGRWLSTVHFATDAIGMLQYSHHYIYYEIEQHGDAFTVEKGLLCGTDAITGGLFEVSVEFRASQAAAVSKVSLAGRKGTSVEASGGCKIELQKWYTVQGATLPYYLDPGKPLPSAADEATGATPGWEDWDGDGHPGITGVLSGTISGKIFVAPRLWTSMAGTVPHVGSVFRLPLQWDQEPNIMAYEGSELLASEVARASDPKVHFVEFARLRDEQATGDDLAVCKSIVALAPTLTPAAAGM